MKYEENSGNGKGWISVIIPTFKRVGMLGRAIDSVLEQTYKLVEVIVVDDNDEESTYRKETEEFMKIYSSNSRVVYLKHKKNKNGAAARNTGILFSSAEYIAFLDDDDEFLPQKLEKQIKKISELPNAWGGVYCGCDFFVNNKLIKKVNNLPDGNLKKELLMMKNSIYGGSTLLLRRNILMELGGFDETFIRHQDWELLVRFFRKYKVAFVNEALVNIHLDSNINRPNASKLQEVKNKFLQEFEQDIKEFDYKTQCEIYKAHFQELLSVYLQNKRYRYAWKYYKKIRDISTISFKENIIMILNILEGITNLKIKQKLRCLIFNIHNLLYKKSNTLN